MASGSFVCIFLVVLPILFSILFFFEYEYSSFSHVLFYLFLSIICKLNHVYLRHTEYFEIHICYQTIPTINLINIFLTSPPYSKSYFPPLRRKQETFLIHTMENMFSASHSWRHLNQVNIILDETLISSQSNTLWSLNKLAKPRIRFVTCSFTVWRAFLSKIHVNIMVT